MESREGRYYLSNFLISLFVGLFLLISIFFSYIYFAFNLLEISFVIVVCVLLYGFTLVVLIYTSKNRRRINKGNKKSGNEIIDAIVNEVYNKVNEEPIDIPVEVGFVGNSKAKVYHKVDCKLAHSVDSKHRLENNNEEFFKRRKFKKCKICFKK